MKFYENNNELRILETNNWIISAWSWYLQNNSWALSFSGNITWSEYSFDFTLNDYAIFLKSTGTWTLLYKIKWETTSWTWIYITPIDDSDSKIVRYLWNEIIITEDWEYISKQLELIYKK